MVSDTRRGNLDHDDDLYMRLYINEQSENFQEHWHSDVEIIMVIENTYTVVIEGMTEYLLKPGDIMIIPLGVSHELIAPSSGKRVIILFNKAKFKDMNIFPFLYDISAPCIHIRSNKKNKFYGQLYSLIEGIVEEYSKCEEQYEVYIYSMLMMFLSIVARNCVEEDGGNQLFYKRKKQTYIKRLVKVCKYIEENCTKNINVDDLSELAGYSNSHFSRLFQEFTGDTYYDYITKQRLILAEEMLSNSDLAIVDIAMRSGFNSLATFNRNFRKAKKCTPSQFRSEYGVHNRDNLLDVDGKRKLNVV